MANRITRRSFLRRSVGWTVLAAAGCASPLIGERRTQGSASVVLDPADPIDEAPDFSRIERAAALAFSSGFIGDDYRRPHDIILDRESVLRGLPGGVLPEPDERVPVVVVGGGLAGLASAYLLRDLHPVLLEQDPRFGGNSKGERWRNSTYSIGAAYFIQPDEGDELDRLYEEIGIKGMYRLVERVDPVEYRGKVYRSFWEGEAAPGSEAAYAAYAEKIREWTGDDYPDIPIVEEDRRAAVDELDRRSLKDVVTEWLGGSVPESMRAALQNYCYSSLGAGWEDVSAAAGINFLAGEEFGECVLPGGNAAIARAFLRALKADGDATRLRTGCVAFEVKRTPEGVRVAYVDRDGRVRTLLAKTAVLACQKFVVKHVLADIEPDRLKAIEELRYHGYLVVDVLLRKEIEDDFYDLYMLRDGKVLDTPGAPPLPTRVTDVIRGNWARRERVPGESVLTLYWPIPFASGREEILFDRDAWDLLRPEVEKQVLEILPLLDVDPDQVEQVRMARWGHAVPVAAVGLIARGIPDVLRRPVDERIFFVNQDNWALPAIETCLTEALQFAPRIRAAAV